MSGARKPCRKHAALVTAIVLTAIVTGPAAPRHAFAGVTYGWDGVTYITNENENYYFTIGGRLFDDATVVSASRGLREAITDIEDGAEVRSARLGTTGEFRKAVEYNLVVEFSSGDPTLINVFTTVRRIPLASWIRVGYQKEPFGLEKWASLKRIPFVERSLLHSLVPMRTGGVNVCRELAGGNAAVMAGIFKGTSNPAGYENDGIHFTTRLVAAPVHDEERARLLHVGASLSVRRAESDEEEGVRTLGYSTGPENHLLPDLVDTGSFEAASAVHWGGEFAAVRGPWSFQSEAVVVSTAAAAAGDPSFWAFYALGSYIITGEHRMYRIGRMEGVRPGDASRGRNGNDGIRITDGYGRRGGRNGGGKGAWELALRISTVDLNDGAVAGGVQTNVTAGLNWYLNRYVRWMFNYIHADVRDAGTAHQFLTRFQIEF